MLKALPISETSPQYKTVNDCMETILTDKQSGFSESQLDSGSINVLNWNILKGDRRFWKRDYKRISQNMDVVLIQEAYLNGTVLDGLNSGNQGWIFSPSFFYAANKVPTGVLTATYARPEYCRALRATEPIIRTPKSSLITKYRLSNSQQMLLIANVHAINFALGTGSFRSQARELKSEMLGHTGPMILAGDFNTWSVKRIKSLREITEELGLRSVRFSTDLRKKVFKKPVDHIFYRGMEVVRSRVVRVKSSDHNPMIVEFKVDKKPVAKRGA